MWFTGSFSFGRGDERRLQQDRPWLLLKTLSASRSGCQGGSGGAGPGRPLGLGGKPLDEAGELFDARVGLAVLAGGVAGVDALEDDRELPVAEGDEEVELGEIAAGALLVP